MNRFALWLVGLGFLLAATLVGCSQNPDTKPQAAGTPKAEGASEPTFQTLILGKWRSPGPGPTQVWEFKTSGVVNRTITITGTVQASEVVPKDEPITLGSIAQSGKYTFVNDKLFRVALEEGKSKGMSVSAAESDWWVERITPTEMVVKFKGQTAGSTFKKVE